jgi:hypothetical protein
MALVYLHAVGKMLSGSKAFLIMKLYVIQFMTDTVGSK